MNSKKEYKKWISQIVYEEDAEKLKNMNESEIYESFYKNIEFGVAGARELMGLGTNRVNIYTVRNMANAYLKFLKNKYGTNLENRNVIVVHDTRYNSPQFAIEVAIILSQANIKVYLAQDNTDAPTPLGCAIIQHKKSIGAVIVSASHNPKDYNGLKIYNDAGAQSMPIDTNIITKYFVSEAFDFSAPKKISAFDKNICYLDEADNNYYLSIAKSILLHKEDKKHISIAFSPVFGTTRKLHPQLFTELGYKYYIVEKQAIPDPNFGHLEILNPENINTFSEATKLAIKHNCDIVLLSDPDGDRLGCQFKNKRTGKYELLSTNKIALMLLIYYIQNGIQVANKYIYKNFVSATLIEEIANEYNVKIIDVPIGPKWMSNGIYDDKNTENYLFAYEESCGFIISDLLRDKDSGQAIAITAEMLNYYHESDMDFEEFYKTYIAPKYGYLNDDRIYLTLLGSKGIKQMQDIMNLLRNEINDVFLDQKIYKKVDYLEYKEKKYRTNLLRIYLNNDKNWIAIRPSGTEPKLKFYLNIIDSDKNKSYKMFVELKDKINRFISDYTLNN